MTLGWWTIGAACVGVDCEVSDLLGLGFSWLQTSCPLILNWLVRLWICVDLLLLYMYAWALVTHNMLTWLSIVPTLHLILGATKPVVNFLKGIVAATWIQIHKVGRINTFAWYLTTVEVLIANQVLLGHTLLSVVWFLADLHLWLSLPGYMFNSLLGDLLDIWVLRFHACAIVDNVNLISDNDGCWSVVVVALRGVGTIPLVFMPAVVAA